MGADGGICWAVLSRDPNAEKKLRAILPWPILSWDDAHDYDSETMGHDHFLDQIPMDAQIIGTTGSFQPWCLLRLNDIREDHDDEFLVYKFGADWRSLTFRDILLCMPERPTNALEELIDYSYSVESDSNEEHILDLTLGEWYDTLRSCMVGVGSIETWT